MSQNRRRKTKKFKPRQRQTAASPAESNRPQQPPPSTAAQAPRRRWKLTAAVAVWLAWLILLVVLAVFTANPVTLHRLQIARSTLIVTATIKDIDQPSVQISKTWRGNSPAESIQVMNLNNVPAIRAQEPYLIPLVMDGNAFRITTIRNFDDRPIIYPATPETVSQLERILAEIDARGHP